MSEGPQYTSCVDKDDFVTVGTYVGVANVVGVVAAILLVVSGFPAAGLVVAFAAGAEILRKVAEWLLKHKLICLSNVKRRVFNDADPDRVCVLGAVLDFEKVGEDKSGFEKIDNDFALNLFLAPTPLAVIVGKDLATLTHAVEITDQGDLIQNPDVADSNPLDPTALPKPLLRKDNGAPFGAMPKGFSGYSRTMMFSAAYPRLVPKNVYDDPHELIKVDPKFAQMGDEAYAEFSLEVGGLAGSDGTPLSEDAKNDLLSDAASDPLGQPRISQLFYLQVSAAFHFTEIKAPSLHCEFEGARIRDVYNVLDFAHIKCDTSGFWGFACDVLNLLVALFLGLPKLIAAAAAWALADDGKLSNSYDGKGGEINFGDSIVLKGRWAYDGGHDGYNEIHGVRTVQKTFGPGPLDAAGFRAFHDEWCTELARIPPADPAAGTPANTSSHPLTPSQQATRDAQARPENRWVLHPVIDGCEPVPSDVHPGLH